MSKTRCCWDSCVFIAILSDEKRTEEDLVALYNIVDAVDRNLVSVVTSVVIQAEVLDAIREPVVASRFRHLLNLPNVLQATVTSGIARRAGEIRVALQKDVKLKSLDAFFIATALAHKCDSLQTYDRKLLGLSGRSEVLGLKITKPVGEQTVLPL